MATSQDQLDAHYKSQKDFEQLGNPTGFQPGDLVQDSNNQENDDMINSDLYGKNQEMITLKPEFFEQDGKINFVTDSNRLNDMTSNLSDEKFVLLNKEPYPLKITTKIEQEFDSGVVLNPEQRLDATWQIYTTNPIQNTEKDIFEDEYKEKTVFFKNGDKTDTSTSNITSIKPKTGIFSFGNKSTKVYAVKKIYNNLTGFNDIKKIWTFMNLLLQIFRN